MKWCLKSCRIQSGFTQTEVAEIVGCTEKTIVQYESGRSAPKMDIAQSLSELYGIPMGSMDFSMAGNSVKQRRANTKERYKEELEAWN